MKAVLYSLFQCFSLVSFNMDSQITLLQAAALAVIQGITEFVPVSSSGHLVLARAWLGWSGDCGLTFDTVFHAGSLLALLLYFRSDLSEICAGWLALIRPNAARSANVGAARNRRELWLLAASTVPSALAGPFLKPAAEGACIRNSLLTGACMIATALLLFAADRKRSSHSGEMSFLDALIVGCAQVVALLPGASRSGWTISAALFRGADRSSAVRFSFLMAIPVMAGALVFQAKDIAKMSDAGIEPLTTVLGFLVSFAVSLGAIHFCVSFFRRHRLRPFAIYLLAVGSLGILSFFAAGGF